MTTGTRLDFLEPQRKKQESTPLPLINNNIESGMSKTATKVGVSNSTRIPRESSAHTSVTPDAMTWANAWETMNRTLEAFATRNSDSSDRGGGKSRKTFKKPKEFKDNSDGCIDTWVEVMRLHLEQDNLNDERRYSNDERQHSGTKMMKDGTAVQSNLEGTARKFVVVKKEEERDTADKTFEILLNCFASGTKGHQAMMRIEKRRQREDDSIERFLDDLESLRRRSDPEEPTNRRYFSIASKFIDGVKSNDLRTRLATYYTLSKDNAPTPEQMRQKSRENMLMKLKKTHFQTTGICKGEANSRGRHGTSQEMIWTNENHVQIVATQITM